MGSNYFAVIMAGGSGERFWPLSRKARPKQLLRLTDPDKSMLQEAADRISPLVGEGRVIVATATHLAETIGADGLVDPSMVIAEPDKRNTLGCLTWVTASLMAKHGADSHALGLAILTADHLITPEEIFRSDVALALKTAEETGGLVTIGIPPRRPETGYGYIEVRGGTDGPTMQVASFREKPDFATARSFVDSGNFYWNSGMFFWTVGGFMDQLQIAHPEAHALTEQMAAALANGDVASAEARFRDLPNLSIDYALMEKATLVSMVPARFAWDDVGAFDALIRTLPEDEFGNVSIGHVVAVDTHGCVLYNDSPDRVLSVVGMRDHILVQTQDAVLVAPLSDAQRVKEIVTRLKETHFV